AVWIAGAVFYFRAFARVLGPARGFWIALLLVLMPAWGVTSMKAWSGYATSFAASGLVLDLVVGNEQRRGLVWLAAGVATAVVYLAQPLWLPSLAPIVFYCLATSRRLRCWMAYLSGTAVPIAVMTVAIRYWLADTNEVWWRPEVGNPHLFASLPAFLAQIYM